MMAAPGATPPAIRAPRADWRPRMSAPAALGEDYGLCVREKAARSASQKGDRLRRAKAIVADHPKFKRFQACSEAPAPRAKFVSINRKGDHAWFGGLVRCSMPWICPVCAPRIAEGRRDDLQAAIDNTIRKERGVILVTLTFPHGAGDVLQDILDRFSKAQRYFKSGRAAADRRKRLGFFGEVRTLEVTHGANGWHPHAHSLWFTEQKLSQEQIEALTDELYQDWRRSCLKAGLPEPSRERGVDVRNARYAGEYVAKWGFAAELASHTSKRGKLAGRTPWQLLADATDGDRYAAWLWREFALGFHGKRQLFWSRGLRDRLAMAPELTEQQILDLEDARAHQVMTLDLDTWYVIRKARAQECVLELAVSDLRELYAYLNRLRCTVTNEFGQVYGPREDWEL